MATYYTRQLLSLCFFALLLHFSTNAQTVCPNSDFSQGGFNGWTGRTGNYNNPAQATGIVNGRHTIITTPGIDPNTCGGLQMLPPGATTSARLGNQSTGSEAEQLIYQTNVTAGNSLFVYKYAVVLEDAGHTPAEQPEFRVRVLNQAGQQVSGNCGIYTVYGGQPGQNFQTCGGVTWLPWTIVGVDLSPYIGQTINIEFTTKDCSQSGHYGYAYISCECLPLLVDVEYCEGSNSVTMSAPDGFSDYLWQQTGETTQSITVPNPTIGATYTCVVTTFSNQGNCSLSLDAQVVPTSIEAGYTASPNCINTPIQFTDTSIVSTGTGNVNSWLWNFGDGLTSTAQNPTHSYTTAGTFNVSLVAYSSIGCSDTVVKTLTVYDIPDVDFDFQNECINESVQFDNQTTDAFPLTYEWDFGDGSAVSTATDPAHTYTTDGQYTVELTAENSQGCVNSMQQPLTIFPLPAISAGADVQVCPNAPVTLNGSGGSTYTWDNGGVNNVPFVPTGSNTFTVTGTDVNGCQNTDAMQLTLFAPPVVNAGPDQVVCDGTAVIFTGSGVVSYVWDNGITNGLSFTAPVGTHTYTVTGTDANGCTDTDIAQLTVNANPVIGAGTDQIICVGAQTFVAGTGAGTGGTYAWDNGVTNAVVFGPAASATYTVIGTDINGCQGTDQVAVNIEAPALPEFSAPVTDGCEPVTVQFAYNSTGTGGASCLWEFGDGANASGCGAVSHQYMTPGCYDVGLTVTTGLGCVWNLVKPNFICVYPNPVAAFTPVPGEITEIDPVAEMSNSSTGAVSYSWNFDDGSTSNEEDPEHQFPTNPIQNFMIHLTAVSDHGCIDTTQHNLVMKPVLIYYVPNVFTPDFDQFNQTFQPVFTSGYDPYDFNMAIFNRWGEIIFETNNAAIGWDGTYHGELVKEGVYTWKIEFKTTINDERKAALGNVTLLR